MPWHDGLDEAGLEVDCDGRRHRVRWHRGRLQLVDHPDPRAEAVLAALGAPPPACLQVLALWRLAVADGGFLTEWAGREEPDPGRQARIEAGLARLHREGVQDVLPELESRRAERMGVMLARFPHDLVDRAALAAVQRLLRRPDLPAHELAPWLAHAVRVRARSAFVRALAGWGHHARPAALVRFRCRVGVDVDAQGRGRLDGRASWCEVVLDAAWLLRVWGPGLAVVDGRLVLDARGTAGDRSPSALLTLDWVSDRGRAPVARPRWREARPDGTLGPPLTDSTPPPDTAARPDRPWRSGSPWRPDGAARPEWRGRAAGANAAG